MSLTAKVIAPLLLQTMEQGWTDALAGLLAGEDERLVTRVHEPGAAAGHGTDPRRAAPRRARGARRARHHLALLPPGGRLGERHAARAHDRHDRHRERQVAVLQPAGAARAGLRPARAGALPVSDQGARAGPGAQPDRAAARPPCATRSTTATRRRRSARAIRKRAERRAHEPRHAARRHPAPPRRLGRLPREPGARGRGRGARLPRRVRLARRQRAAPAAPARATPTGPSRGSCSRRRRSPTRSSLARGADRARVRPGRPRRRAARRARDRDVQPAAARRAHRRAAPRASARPPSLFADLVAAEVRTICFARSRRARRADLPVRAQAAGGRRPSTRGPHRALPRRLHAAAAARDRARAWRAASCSAWSPRTRSSSASTSATSTPRSRSRSPARSRACASSGAARAARERGGLAMYVAGDDALDQFFCRHPEEFLERPVEAAILDHCSETIYMRHLVAAAYEAPLEPADAETLGAEIDGRRGPAGRRRASCASAAGATSRASRRSRRRKRLAALGLAGQLHDRRGRGAASCSASSRPSARSRPSIPAPSTCTWASPTRSRSSTSTAAARSCARPRATTTRSRRSRPRRSSRRPATSATRSGCALRFGIVSVTRGGRRLPAQAPVRPRGDRPPDARPARAELRHAGALVRARRDDASASCRCTRCSARCTRPSTPRSPCCR